MNRSTWACCGVLVIFVIGFHIPVICGAARFPYDYEGFHFPLLYFNSKILGALELPSYNPFVYAGIPYFSNAQSGYWYPPHIAFALLTWAYGGPTLLQAQWLNIVHFVFGAVGVLFLLRRQGVGGCAALAGACLFVVNGHILAQSQHLGVIETMSWLPWALLAVGWVAQRRSWTAASVLGMLMAMPALVGFLPMAASFYGITCAAIIWSLLGNRNHRFAHTAVLGWSALVCLGVSAPLVLPLLVTMGDAVELRPHGSMPVRMLSTLFAPGIYGQFGPPEHYRGVIDVTVDYLYMGAAVLGVASSSIIIGPRRARQLLGVALICGLVAFAPNAVVRALQAMPVVGPLLRPFTFCFPMALFGILSAAHVVDRHGARIAPIMCWVGASVCGLFCAAVWTAGDRIDGDLLLRLIVPLATVSMSLILLPKHARSWALCVLIVAEPAAVNFNRTSWAYPGSPNIHSPTMVDGQGQELLKILRADERSPHRVAVDQEALGGPWNGYWPVWGIESINGFDPQVPSIYFEEVRRRLATWYSDRLFNPGQLDSSLFETLNVKFMLSRQRLDSPLWRHVMTDGIYNVHEFVRFRPRYDLMTTGGGESVDLGEVTLVRRSISGAALRVTVSVDLAVLVIRERAYPEWRVTVNGSHASTLVIDKLVMGIELPRGSHEVTLEYVPKELHWGLAIAGLTLGACAAVILVGAVWLSSPRVNC